MNRLLSINFFEFEMLNNKSVMNKVDELLLLISRLKDLEVEVAKQLK